MSETANSLYQILLDTVTDTKRIKLVVEEFIHLHSNNIEQVNFELIQLILCFLEIEESNVTSSAHGDNLVNEVIDLIKIYSRRSISFKNCDENVEKVLFIFFEYLFAFSSEFFTNKNSFVNFLPKLAKSLASYKESTVVRYCGYMIQLTFVSALVQNDTLFNCENLQVGKYAENLLQNSIYETYSKIPISALREYEKWLNLKPEIFLKPAYYDIVLMNFGHPKVTIAVIALNVTLTIFSQNNLTEYCTVFVSKLCSVLEKVLATRKEEKIFELICKICVQIHKRYAEIIHSSKLCGSLWLELFSLKRSRAKMAAVLWFKYELGDNTNERKIQLILQFLGDADSTAFSLIVDTLLLEFTIITDWNLFLKILTNKTSLNFTENEKEKLLKLMAFSVCQSITGRKPDICFISKNLDVPNYRIRHSITRIVLPHLRKILTDRYSNQTLGVFFFMLQHLDFKFAKPACIEFLMHFCRDIFLDNCEIAVLLPTLRLMKTISEKTEEKRLQNWCNDILLQLKMQKEYQFFKIVTDIQQQPNKYLNSEIRMETNKLLKQMYVLNLHVRLDDKYLYELPKEILNSKIIPDNPVYLMTMEICIYLYTDFIVEEIKAQNNFENLVRNLKQYVQMMLTHFNVNFTGRRGEIFYFSLCKVLLELNKLNLPEDQLKFCLVYEVHAILEAYVRITICGFQKDKIKTHLNEPTKYEILKTYMNLVINDILPLSYTSDILGTLQTNIKTTRDVWREFLVIICQKMEKDVVSKWLLRVLELRSRSNEDFVHFVKQLATLFIPMRKETQAVLEWVHKVSIVFVEKLSKESRFPDDFMAGLTELTACLKQSTKYTILKYINDKNLSRTQVIRKYISELKKSTIHTKEETSSFGSENEEEVNEQSRSYFSGLAVSSLELIEDVTRTSLRRISDESFNQQ